MKKQIFIISIILFILFGTILNTVNAVDAASATVTLAPSKTEVKPGDTFTVTVSATCTNNFEGVDSFLVYDKENLEYNGTSSANSNWGSILAEDVSNVAEHAANGYQYSLAAAASDAKASDSVMVISFKVKDNATANATAKIALNGIKVFEGNQEKTAHEVGTKETSVKIIGASNASAGNQAENIKDKTETQSKATTMPKTGVSLISISAISITFVTTLITYKLFREYKNI